MNECLATDTVYYVGFVGLHAVGCRLLILHKQGSGLVVWLFGCVRVCEGERERQGKWDLMKGME